MLWLAFLYMRFDEKLDHRSINRKGIVFMYKNDEFEGIEPIAIIGMSCRFPDADNIDEFWNNLKNGKESVSFFTEDELLSGGLDRDLINDPDYIRAGCIINDIDLFDYSFFDYSAAEAELIDPQQRIFLECAYEAFEDAGYSPQSYDGDIGVFGGMRTSGYTKVLNTLLKRPGTLRGFEAILGTTVDQSCLRISYALNLKGPSIGIQTACSASIVAANMASESLRNGECDMALAGATAIYVPQKQGYIYDDKMITSPDGHCRAFDAKAQGTTPGSGAGMVLLKRLSDAIEERDHIYAVIRGSAVNNDGSSKMGYQAPSIEGQKRVIEEALLIANVNPESITYVEGNGTGTLLGDSMEIEALARAFRTQTEKREFCGIGSVKANIGHLTQAAGIASLIKTALSLKNKQLPPSPNFSAPNPQLQGTPFYVLQKCSEWQTNNLPRRAGINSFAIGGTNAHMILEEAPSIPQEEEKKGGDSFYIFTVSAKSENALRTLASRYLSFFEKKQHYSIGDICFTSNIGRSHYPFRLSAVIDSTEQLYEQISALISGVKTPSDLSVYPSKKRAPQIAYFFSNTFNDEFIPVSGFLYEKVPQFREAMDYCAAVLKTDHGKLLITDLFKDFEVDSHGYAKTTIFAIEYALFQMWNSWGIIPSVIIGNGVGEYVAACAAGVFSVDDGLKMVSFIEDFEENGAVIEKESKEFYIIKDTIDKVSLNYPNYDIVSISTGNLIEKQEICDKNYWVSRTIEQPEFNIKWNYLREQGIDYFVTIGPDTKIRNEFKKENSSECVAVQSFIGDQNEWRRTLKYLGELYVRGWDIDWRQFTKGSPYQRISLPTYPFEKQRCWFEG